MNRTNEGYKLPKLIAPFPIIGKESRPYGHWFNDGSQEKRKTLRKLGIVLIEVILIVAILVAIGSAIMAVTAVPAHADADDFPSYWEMDSYWTEWVQNYLVEWGYNVSIDGQFGPKTAQAVKEFQIDHNLDVTGVVDEAVAKELGFELESGRTLYYMSNLAKTAAKVKGDYLVYVALGGRSGISHIGVFQKKNGSWELIKSEDCLLGEQTNDDLVFLGKTSISRKAGLKTWISEEGYVYAYRNLLELKSTNSSICAFPQLGKELDKTGAYSGYIHVSFDLSGWMNKNLPVGTTVVIDDRAWQPGDL
jgi:hypothetical protein